MSDELIVHASVVGVLAENSYVIGHAASGKGVLVDPGGEVPLLLGAASAAGLDIEAIWLTHAHLDHVAGVPEAVERTGAPVWLHPDDRFLYEAAPQQGVAFGVRIDPLPEPDRELTPGNNLALGDLEIEVLYVPGHSPGHVAFWIPAARAVFSGDCLFAGSIGRTDLAGGDYETLMASIGNELLPLGDDVAVYSGHGPSTTIGEEKATNPFLARY